MSTATAQSHPNIAFIKYWGNQDEALRIPTNGSISMNLDGLHTRTTVTFNSGLAADRFALNRKPVEGPGLKRVSDFLDRVRRLAGLGLFAQVESENNFPSGAGIASSAAAFAALSLAASAAAGLRLSEAELSRLARTGSGSACRSVPGGFVEWGRGEDDSSSYAWSIAPPAHWDLIDCVAVVSQAHKQTGSTAGHARAASSPLQAARVADAPRRLDLCRQAILDRDFEALAEIAELDSNLMHAVMITSRPALFYWLPATLELMTRVRLWRESGIPVFYTIDAGPNVHVICPTGYVEQVKELLGLVPGVSNILLAHPGGAAKYL